jgi:hypothetical protein
MLDVYGYTKIGLIEYCLFLYVSCCQLHFIAPYKGNIGWQDRPDPCLTPVVPIPSIIRDNIIFDQWDLFDSNTM